MVEDEGRGGGRGRGCGGGKGRPVEVCLVSAVVQEGPMHKSKCWMSVAAQSKNATSLGARNANKRSVELGQLSWAI